MTYEEILKNARGCIGPYCKACPVCNGRACSNQMPGPGAKGSGTLAVRNYETWQNIRINMDTICEKQDVSTKLEIFGKTFSAPFFAGPVGSVKLHYGEKYTMLNIPNWTKVFLILQEAIKKITDENMFSPIS